MKIELLVIDPQNDFCKPNGALPVTGADKDMERLAVMIEKLIPVLDDVHVTLDSHDLIHIAHPIYWKDPKGNHPTPGTIISDTDVINGVWMTSLPSLQKRGQEYVTKLKANGRYPLCIWNPHCLVGSPGWNIYTPVYESLLKWEEKRYRIVDKVIKGNNPHTEHYSPIKADVPDPADPSTGVNMGLVNILDKVDFLLVAGEASSHCLANGVRDLVAEFGKDDYVKKIIFLKDAASPVVLPTIDFTFLADDFIKDMTAKGMQVSDTVNVLKMFNI